MPRRPMLKLERVGKKKIGPLASHQSLKRLFKAKEKLKFYRAANGKVFALSRRFWGESGRANILLADFDGRGKEFKPFAKAEFNLIGDKVRISKVTALPEKTEKVEHAQLGTLFFFTERKTGYNVFRLILNEAIAIARKKGLKKISLFPQSSRLHDYYQRFGFEMEETGDRVLYLKG